MDLGYLQFVCPHCGLTQLPKALAPGCYVTSDVVAKYVDLAGHMHRFVCARLLGYVPEFHWPSFD